MKKYKELSDDEIRVIEAQKREARFWLKPSFWLTQLVIVLIFLAFFAFKEYVLVTSKPTKTSEQTIKHISASSGIKYTQVNDTIVDGMPLRLLIPSATTEAKLHIGALSLNDTSIVLALPAADIREDNGEIVGAFILDGQQISRGLSEDGFCAIVDNRITVGVAKSTRLFEEASQSDGYFFRQYPLVDNGVPVYSNPKGKSILRALCEAGGDIFVVESLEAETLMNFADKLVSLGVQNAIYLYGGNDILGWYRGENQQITTLGDTERENLPTNTSYIVWII